MAGTIDSSGTAVWTGGLKRGKGKVSAPSGAFRDLEYSFHSRFENGGGTTPEEMIAVAHAGCFSMALSMVLGEDGIEPERIETKATVSLRETEGGFQIFRIHLAAEGRAPGLDAEKFQVAAEKAKENCPVSVLLKPGLEELTLEAKLVG